MSVNVDIEKFGETLSDDELIKLIRGGRDEESALSALNELSRRRSPRQLEVFHNVLDDPEQSLRAKRTVAARLGVQPLKENQELLLRHLTTGDPTLFVRIVQSLGNVGDHQALERLEATKAPDDNAARRSLEFAKTLLSYRLRLDRHLIAKPSEDDLVKVTDAISFKAEKADEKTLREAIAKVTQDLPAIPLAADRGEKLTCRSIELLLLFNAEFQEPSVLQTLRERPAIPMVLLKRGLSEGGWFLDRYLFTHPSKDGKEIVLLGTRPSGEVTYAGIAQASDKGFSFTLKSVDTRYAAAIEVEGQFDPGQRLFKFQRAISSTRIAARKRTPGQPQKATPGLGGGRR